MHGSDLRSAMAAIAQLTRSVFQLGMAPVRTVKERVSAGGSGLVDDVRDEVRQVIDATLKQLRPACAPCRSSGCQAASA